MKKHFTTVEFKDLQKRRQRKTEKKLRSNNNPARKRKSGDGKKNKRHRVNEIKYPVFAPADMRLIENTVKCLEVFREMRSEEALSRKQNVQFVVLNLKNVKQIDYGSISILTAISDDLKYNGIILRTFYPDDMDCRNFIYESGYYNHQFDVKGKTFPKAPKSDLLFFEKGSGILKESDNIRISNMIKAVVNHLTGESKHCLAVRTIILEICGNSIEWSGTDSRQWLLGVKYEEGKVVFTVTDVGRGILKTLNKRFRLILKDLFTLKTPDDILKGAFNKKYGSTTEEENRNKGLPAVKSHWEQRTINSLKVLTNNVILHFDNDSESKTFNSGSPWFKGTFYQWEMDNSCIKKIME